MSGLRARLAGQNPFYLASAGCMLLGCYLLTDAGSEAPRALARVLPSVACLSVYEIALVTLAAFLIRRRGLYRDGRCLLVLAAVFFSDATHLSAETVTSSQGAWIGTTLALLAFSAGKIALVAYGLGVGWRRLCQRSSAVALVLVFAVPGAFAALVRSGASLDLPLYGAAWVAGLLLTLAAMRPESAAVDEADAPAVAAASFQSALAVSLLVSFAAHVLTIHWLYDVHFPLCSLTPALLALAVRDIRSREASRLAMSRATLPALAVVLSMGAPASFTLGAAVVFSPLRAALVVAAIIYVYDFVCHRQVRVLVFAATCATFAIAGPSASEAHDRLASLFPRTRQQWGGLSVLGAYLLLSIGAWSSLRSRTRRVGP